jgi:branched-subunit amino acid transport protein AzlD
VIIEQVRTTDKRTSTWRLPAAVAIVSAAVFLLARPHLIDDTFITLAYARNLAFRGHWGLLADATSNSATSPANVLALAALTVVVRDAVFAAGVLYVLCQVALVLALRRLGTVLPRWFPALTFAALTVNPLLLSSIGLEVALGAAVLGWLTVFAVERRPLAFGPAAGLLALVRLDLLIFAVVLGFSVRSGKVLLGAAAVALPWFAFSWVVLGAAVPDTFVIKTLQGAQRAWGDWNFANGPLFYLRTAPWPTVLSFLPLLAVPFAVRTHRPFALLALGGALYHGMYVLLTVPPYHWYYGPEITAATISLCAWVSGRLAVGGVLTLVAASVVTYASPGLPREFAPLTSNYASSAKYTEIGRDLHALAGARVVGSAGEIGVLAYTCECAIVDVFADRGLLPAAIEARGAGNRWLRAALRVDYAFFDFDVHPRRPDLLLRRLVSPPPDALARWTLDAPTLGRQELYLVPARNG